MILAAVVSIFILALVAPLLQRLLPNRAGWVLSLLPLALTVFFASKIPPINGGQIIVESCLGPQPGRWPVFLSGRSQPGFFPPDLRRGHADCDLLRRISIRSSQPRALLSISFIFYGLDARPGFGRQSHQPLCLLGADQHQFLFSHRL